MGARGADHSSTPTTDWRLNGDTYGSVIVRKRDNYTNGSAAPVFIHDACNDHGW